MIYKEHEEFTFHPKGETNIYKKCPQSSIISGVEPTKTQRKGALNDMIDKVEFTAKNLTSNAGVLLIFNYTEEQRIFQELDEMLVFDNESTEAIKMNYLKTLICGGFVGADKLERFLLLKAEQLMLKEIRKEPLKDTILVTKATTVTTF